MAEYQNIDDAGPSRRSTERPLGIKLYIGFYSVAWALLLLFLIAINGVAWLFIPVPFIALYILYKLWHFSYWAWIVILALHIVSFAATIIQFWLGSQSIEVLIIDLVLTPVIVGYLYSKAEYFT
jgi:hypothetical protein